MMKKHVLAMILIQCTIIALQYIAGGSILASLLQDIFNMKSDTFFSFLIIMLVGVVGGMGVVPSTYHVVLGALLANYWSNKPLSKTKIDIVNKVVTM